MTARPAGAEPRRSVVGSAIWRSTWLNTLGRFAALLVVFVFFALLVEEGKFYTLRNLENILRQSSVYATAALGMTRVTSHASPCDDMHRPAASRPPSVSGTNEPKGISQTCPGLRQSATNPTESGADFHWPPESSARRPTIPRVVRNCPIDGSARGKASFRPSGPSLSCSAR